MVAIYILQKYVNKSLSAIFSAFFFLDEKDDFMLYNIFFDVIPWSWHKNSLPLPRISKYNGFDYQAKRQCSGEKLLFKGSLG